MDLVIALVLDCGSTLAASLAAASLSSNRVSKLISDTSGGKLAIASRVITSPDAELSSAIIDLMSSWWSGASTTTPKSKTKI